jgi:hypothetical protein
MPGCLLPSFKYTGATPAIFNTDTVSLADNTKISVSVAGTKTIVNSYQFLIIDTGTVTVTTEKLTIINENSMPMVSFSSIKSGNKLYLVASRDAAYYCTNTGNPSLGNTLKSLVNTATGDMSYDISELDKSGSATNARKLEPIVNNGLIQTSISIIQ